MKVVFRPSKVGLGKTLGAGERLVLEALWRKGALTGREVYEEVCRSRELAYTTVLTVVGRMVKKGSVKRRKEEGVYVFEAALKKAEFERRVASEVIKGIHEISPAHTVSAFLDVLAEYDAAGLDEIMKVIEERRKAGRQ
jgi:predicted transcriptional regulator